MTLMPDADENRRLGRIDTEKADKLPPGEDQDALRKKARNRESAAHSADWRNSDLHRPD